MCWFQVAGDPSVATVGHLCHQIINRITLTIQYNINIKFHLVYWIKSDRLIAQ